MTARTTLLLILLSAPAVRGDDWPQWMGPKRDNIWREDGLLEKFPAGGPKVVWTAPIAGGYSGPAVASGRIFVTDYVTDQNVKVENFDGKEYSGTERVLCLDEASGKEIWKHEYPVKYSISYPAGPRCTPNVHEGKVYTLGAVGNLFCFAADSGKIVWSNPDDARTRPSGLNAAMRAASTCPTSAGPRGVPVTGSHNRSAPFR